MLVIAVIKGVCFMIGIVDFIYRVLYIDSWYRRVLAFREVVCGFFFGIDYFFVLGVA